MSAHDVIRAFCVIMCVISLSVDSARAREDQPALRSAAAQLQSVGKLLVPGIRFRNGYPQHFDERCSATLVTHRRGAVQSDLILSAWHCVEQYRDLSRNLYFDSAGGQRSAARILASGDGMQADWLLLKLSKPMPYPTFVGLAPDKFSDEGARAKVPGAVNGEVNGKADGKAHTPSLLMAGYPRDSTTQTGGLETAAGCHRTGRDGRDVRSNCVLKKGASGGAVFQLTVGYTFMGVISRGDGESQSIYVPLERFRRQIRPFFNDTSVSD